jgi:hypothetical protein
MTAVARLAVFVLLAANSSFGSDVSWKIVGGGGYDTNPAGYAVNDPQALGWSQLDVEWSDRVDQGMFEAFYSGNGYSFIPNGAWSAHEHTVGARYTDQSLQSFSWQIGAHATGSWNHPDYEAYSFREFGGNGSITLAKRVPMSLTYDATVRQYGTSPEFNYHQHELTGATRYSFSTRTVLGLSGKFAYRVYTTQTLDDLRIGNDGSTSRQTRITGFVSQNIVETVGIRVLGYVQSGTGANRWRDDYWQVLGDPLATSGFGGRVQLSWLAPFNLTLRPYLALDRVDETYVDDLGYDANRQDRRVSGGTIVEGSLPWLVADRLVSFTVDASTKRQRSSDPLYSYEQFSLLFGFRYAW